MEKSVTIYTDGACSGNPGPGGWGAVLVYKDIEKEISGGEAQTTNNRMELTAVIRALQLLKYRCKVHIVCDSKYVIDSIENGWARGWRRNGWKNASKKTPPNVDLWEILLDELDKHDVTFTWVQGHNGHPYNERCDRMAVAESQKYKNAAAEKPAADADC